MGNSEVYFAPYSKDNVLEILQDRSKKAFSEKVDDIILQHCAKLSSDEHGDARRALDLLRLSGELCDGKKITKLDVEKAHDQLQKDRIELIVSSASYHLKVVIGAVCVNIMNSDTGWTATSTIYNKYCEILRKDTKPLSYRRVVDLLVELENTGLVVSRTLSRGRHGYGTEYKLKVSPYMIGPFVGKKWWESVDDTKEREEQLDMLRKIYGGR